MSVNICRHCKKEFLSKRSDKQHCSNSCRAIDRSAKAKIPALPSEAMQTLGLALSSMAPSGTIGYRLGLALGRLHNVEEGRRQDLYWFPSLEGRSMRWDGSFSDRPYFLLSATQFEPPRVPAMDTYVIHFVDEEGLTLPTPGSLTAGIKIAEASRMSWPGTHGVRQSRGGRVRSVVELSKIAMSSSTKVNFGHGSRR